MTAVASDAMESPVSAGGAAETEVVAIVRDLVLELGGERVAAAVTATASLERDLGLGSLERVELLARLETAFGRELDDRFLVHDSAREIAAALPLAPVLREPARVARAGARTAAAVNVDDAATIVDALRRRAAAEPVRTHALVHEGEGERRLSYGELWDGATRIAAGLAAVGVARGEAVALMLPTSVDYLEAFCGVLAAGGIAVPLYPPARLDRMAEYLQRQARILANAGARVLIAIPEAGPVARMLRARAPSLVRVVTVESLRSADQVPALPTITGSDAALIQYTSGSTGDPKGVLLTHANLLANIRAIAAGVELRPTDAAVSWLPLYHDMGLIGTWLNTLVHGIPLTLLSPLAFLARPERWLWAIHQQRATLSAAPNFAYELCVRKIRDEAIAGLDVSSWRIAANGSEPVSPATLDRFAERFAPYGFRREALTPMYGLAECAVALCLPAVGRGPRVDVVARAPLLRDGRALPATGDDAAPLRFVSVGKPIVGHEVRVLDATERDVAERVVGRVVFRGPSRMAGYYHNAEATARATVAGDWTDTGDLAYRADGELFVTGRVKDLIKKGGRNLVPQEIEEVVGAIDGIRKGCVAAFGIADEASGTERVVVLAESRLEASADRERLAREATATVAAQVGVPPDVVRIVAPGIVPKTPSGKIRRSAARDAFERGDIAARAGAPLRLRLGLLGGAAVAWLGRGARAAWRAAQVAYLAVALTVALVVLGPIALVLLHLLPPGRPVRTLGRVVSRVALAISGCRLHVEGKERLPRAGPLVLVSNHGSYADTPVLAAALPLDFAFVAMLEIVGWRVIGTFARRGRHPTVDRWHPQQSIADAAAIERRLRAGDALLFFAEGGFSGVRGLRPFRLGGFEAAVSAGAPVVPVALRGSREILPADHYVPRPGTVHVWIGEPIRAESAGWEGAIAMRDRAAEAIAAHCGEPRLAPAAAVTKGPP